MYYFKENSQSIAQNISTQLVSEWTGFPVNPAEYIPNTEDTKELKNNLDIDLALRQDTFQQDTYFLHGTRAEIIENNLDSQPPTQFENNYEKAKKYEDKLEEAIQAKKQATLKVYKKDIERLQKEITHLEKQRTQKGLTVSDIMMIEMVIDNKRQQLRDLHEKISIGIATNLQLTTKQKQKLALSKIQRDEKALQEFIQKDKQEIQRKYGHLWHLT